jgi:hypothetical protein
MFSVLFQLLWYCSNRSLAQRIAPLSTGSLFVLTMIATGLAVLNDCQAYLQPQQTELEKGLFHRIRALAFDCAGDFTSALTESKLGVVRVPSSFKVIVARCLCYLCMHLL